MPNKTHLEQRPQKAKTHVRKTIHALQLLQSRRKTPRLLRRAFLIRGPGLTRNLKSGSIRG